MSILACHRNAGPHDERDFDSSIRPFGVMLAIVVVTISAVESSRCHVQQPAMSSAAVTPLAENPLGTEFTVCDAIGDEALTEAEYLKRAGREMSVLRREFRVFDIDGDGCHQE